MLCLELTRNLARERSSDCCRLEKAKDFPLPCSKELFPLGFQLMEGSSQPRPKAVGHYLLEKFQLAGIAKTYIILRKGKWDIPAYFGHGNS